MSRVVVTGASDGIGKSIAIKLTSDGHQVILFGRDEQRLKAVATQCGDAEYYTFDLNNIAEMNEVVSKISTNGVDVLINNAGIWHKVGDLETLDDALIQDVIATNLTSQILLTKRLLRSIRSSKGIIVNVSSKSGITAQKGQSVYSASKWGLRGFTDVLREDLEADGVRVFGVYQSGTNTKLFEKAGDDFPVEQFTDPDDLANVITFMISQPDRLKINEIRIDK